MLFYHCKVSNKITGSSLPDIKDPQILFLSDCEASDIFYCSKGQSQLQPIDLALVELLLLEADPRRIHTISKWPFQPPNPAVQLPGLKNQVTSAWPLEPQSQPKLQTSKSKPGFNKFQLHF